jgi:hypothetical protein
MTSTTHIVNEWKSNAAAILDVRPELAEGGEPFVRILETASGIGLDQSLLIIAPFEPAPLYDVLEQRGFSHATEHIGADEWIVRFTKER